MGGMWWWGEVTGRSQGKRNCNRDVMYQRRIKKKKGEENRYTDQNNYYKIRERGRGEGEKKGGRERSRHRNTFTSGERDSRINSAKWGGGGGRKEEK